MKVGISTLGAGLVGVENMLRVSWIALVAGSAVVSGSVVAAVTISDLAIGATIITTIGGGFVWIGRMIWKAADAQRHSADVLDATTNSVERVTLDIASVHKHLDDMDQNIREIRSELSERVSNVERQIIEMQAVCRDRAQCGLLRDNNEREK